MIRNDSKPASPKRVWITPFEDCQLLSVDGFHGRVYNHERHHTNRFLSMFPKIPVKNVTLYELCFVTQDGLPTAIQGMTIDRLRDALLDLSSNHGLDLGMVEGLQETFPEGVFKDQSLLIPSAKSGEKSTNKE